MRLKKVKLIIFLLVQSLFLQITFAQNSVVMIESSDKKILVKILVNEKGLVNYTVSYNNEIVLKPSALGLIREDEDFSKNLKLFSSSPIESITDNYKMIYAIRKHCIFITLQIRHLILFSSYQMMVLHFVTSFLVNHQM